jgi:predicted dehydrogenase
MYSVGIIGLGSIGRRHARILRSLRENLRISSYRTHQGALQDGLEGVRELDEQAFLASQFDLIVISNPSSLHLRTLEYVLRADLAETVLVEKPFCLPEEAATAQRLTSEFARTRVLPGNCLRFHPVISPLKATIEGGQLGAVLECHAHFGTYLPGWHPYEDYRSSYAARRELGGGAVLTSIHEIDLVHHLFGDGRVTAAYVGRLFLKDIDVEDTAHIVLTLERCKVANVSLNLFERPAARSLTMVCERGVLSWRLGQSSLDLSAWREDGVDESSLGVDASADAMYLNMWGCVLRNELRDFEMTSVFASLSTAASAKAASEGSGWT